MHEVKPNESKLDDAQEEVLGDYNLCITKTCGTKSVKAPRVTTRKGDVVLTQKRTTFCWEHDALEKNKTGTVAQRPRRENGENEKEMGNLRTLSKLGLDLFM